MATGQVNGQVMMPARFTLDGDEEDVVGAEEWPNFQTDCYGFWLWALADHVSRGGDLDEELERAARLVVRYLMGAAEVPCFDCWEENPGLVHTYSVGVNAAGVRDAGELLGDQAALGLAVPLGMVDVNDALFGVMLQRVVSELRVHGGGVRRYLGDSFHGGSQWLLLAATLGWCADVAGQRELAVELLDWVTASADAEGHLPEQVAEEVQSPHMLAFWREKWGGTATPLLWSHAMHIVLSHALE